MQFPFKKSNIIFLLIALSIAGTTPLLAQDCKVLDPNLVGTYAGDCKSGKASGIGKAVGKYTYEGEFKYGLPEGKGKLTDDHGNYYKGSFKKGKREGEGRADALVTLNINDFKPASHFGLPVLPPSMFLLQLQEEFN